MTRAIAEWAWRLALLAALCFIGWELMLLHDDLGQPAEESVVASSDETQDALDAIRDDIADLAQKVNAILVVMARAK